MKEKLNKKLIFGTALALLVFIPVIVGLVHTPYDPNAMNALLKNKAPSFAHIFGTDNFGRDVFSRIIGGASMTFLVSLLTVAIGALLGSAVGAITGYFGGLVDEILMRLNDALASIPSILLALVVVSVMDIGTMNIIVALGIVFVPSFARIMRSEVLKERNKDYVLNARLCGVSSFRIIFVHILPNTKGVFLQAVLIGLNNAILAEAGLSFLGLGVQPPDPSLGRMLSESQTFLYAAPWYALTTGMYIVLSIFAISLIGEGLDEGKGIRKKVKNRINLLRMADLTEKARGNAAGDASSDEEGSVFGNGDICVSTENLCVGFASEEGVDPCLRNVSVRIPRNGIVGIVGESGAGKSLLSKTIMGILPENAVITSGHCRLNSNGSTTVLDACTEEELRKIRGRQISMVFQEPMTSLDPLMKIGPQVKELLDIHCPELNEDEKRKLTVSALTDAGLAAEAVYELYPHELSGGMRQRVMIAMAVILKPELIIADEPTTALDADLQDKILFLLKDLSEKYGISVLLISHDLKVIGKICDRVYVMRDGTVIESGSTEKILMTPEEEYTIGLIRASKGIVTENSEPDENAKILLEVNKLNIYYKQKRHGRFSKETRFRAVSEANLTVRAYETVGIVGKSGSGKTSLVRAFAGFQKLMDGEMTFSGAGVGMVFQDPHSSLNPSKKVGWILEEPLRCSGVGRSERAEAAANALRSVELDESYASRYVSELSGGEKQRVAIALSLMLKHELIILDEPVSALDVTIREQILELLKKLKEERGLAYVFISHDLELVERFCTSVCVMDDGRLSEKRKIVRA